MTVTGATHGPTAAVVGAGAVEDGAVVTASFAGDDVGSDNGQCDLIYTITTSPAEGSASVNLVDPTKFDFDPGGDFQNLALGETRDVSFDYTATCRL